MKKLLIIIALLASVSLQAQSDSPIWECETTDSCKFGNGVWAPPGVRIQACQNNIVSCGDSIGYKNEVQLQAYYDSTYTSKITLDSIGTTISWRLDSTQTKALSIGIIGDSLEAKLEPKLGTLTIIE